MHKITRRRAMRIVAAAAGLPLLVAGVRATVPGGRFFGWQGEVLGAASELTLWHWDEALARRTILKVRHEIERYERIFSLYRDDSEIARLNRDGVLARPSPELVAVIDASQRLGTLSGGAFDITVQPLWRVYEAHFWSRSFVAPDIAARAADVARSLVDFRRIQPGAARIALPPGMAITLNGIAQGFITDRIADLLRNEGFEHAMVDLGEWRALGNIRTAARGALRHAAARSRCQTMRWQYRPAAARHSSRAAASITSSIRRAAPARTRCAKSPSSRRAP